MKKLNELSYKVVSYITAIPPEDKCIAINFATIAVFGVALFALCCKVGYEWSKLP